MSEDIKGNFGKSGVGYDVTVDNSLNVSLSISDTFADGAALSFTGSAPLASIMDAIAAAAKNGTVTLVEGWLKTALEAYEASKA